MTRSAFLITGAATLACSAFGLSRGASAPAVGCWAHRHGGCATLHDGVWVVKLPSSQLAPALQELASAVDGPMHAAGSGLSASHHGQALQLELECMA